MESRGVGAEGDSNFEQILPKQIAEIFDPHKEEKAGEAIVLNEDIFQNFKVWIYILFFYFLNFDF